MLWVQPERNARTMGQVLSFTLRNAAPNRLPRSVDTAAAVIIFPGVRYERPQEAMPVAAGIEAGTNGTPSPKPRH